MGESKIAELYQDLEAVIGKWMGFPANNVVACSSGTAALHLALEAFKMKPGLNVLVPDFTMIACARAVSLAGLTPVFVDCNELMLMDPMVVDQYIDNQANNAYSMLGAVIAVHVYGRQCAMTAINRAADCTGSFLIEDMAEAHGIKPHPQTDAACWSFYKNKIVAGEEGGAVAFRNPVHATLARSLRSLGFTENHDFDHIPRGHNYRMSNLHAKPILRSLDLFAGNHMVTFPNGYMAPSLAEARREIEGWYNEFCPPSWLLPPRDAVWVYDFMVPGMTSQEQMRVVRALWAEGIQARHAFKPMHDQAEYSKCRVVGGQTRSFNSELMSRSVIYLPVVPGQVTRDDCRKAFEVIKGVLR